MDWLKLLGNLGIFGILVGAFTYLLKRYIELSFSKELERYKGELQKEAISFKTTFENLHAQRAVVIRSIYEKIVNARDTFESLIRPFQGASEPSEEEKKKDAIKSYNELLNYFNTNKIYFEKGLADQLDSFIQKFKEIWHTFNKPHVNQESGISRDIEAWDRAWQKLVAEEIPPLLLRIESKFRKILGIE